MSAVTGHAHGIGAAHASSRSAPVKAATTPGIALAAERSIESIRPLATVLRTRARWSIPGALRSAAKRASPVKRAASSRLSMRVPRTLVAGASAVVMSHLPRWRPPSRVPERRQLPAPP